MTEPKRGGLRPPTNDALYTTQIAGLLALGKSATEIARQLNLGYATVKRIAQRDDCKAVVREIKDSYIETAKAVASKAVADMTELAVEGLKKALKEGNINAINTHFRVIGLLGVEEVKKDTGSQNLTIVMPGAHVEKPAIETEFSFEPPEVSSGEQEVDLGPGEA
jgi:DNA-binding phage protein